MDELEPQYVNTIKRWGWGVIFVFDNNHPDHNFAYTYGRALQGRPDLLITGPLSPRTSKAVLNRAVQVDQDSPLGHGDLVDEVIAGVPALCVAADVYAAHMNVALQVRDAVTGLQLLWPDPAGRFPFEDGYNHVGCPQPVFSPGLTTS